MNKKLLWVFGIVAGCSTCRAAAPRFQGGKITTPPVIDGEFSESEWAGATKVTGSYYTDGNEATGFPIEAYLAYDGKYIYFAALCGDPNPSEVRAQEYRKNTFAREDDTVQFGLSTFGLLDNTHNFTLNPRTASHVYIPGGKANKVEWAGEVDSVGKVTDKGWQVEARIPWSILRLPAKTGPTNMRFHVQRQVGRTGRFMVQQYLNSDKVEDMNIWEGIEIPAQARPRALKLLPYSYAGFQQDGKPIRNLGVDLKTPLTNSLELIATANPDFRNIENSILGLDFSYFERLAGESRPFFLEGQEFFGSAQSIFRSQRVPKIDAGAKVIGDLNDRTRVGVMTLQDFGKQSSSVVSVTGNPDDTFTYNTGLAHLDREDLQSAAAYASMAKRLGKATASARWSRHHDSVIGTGNDFATNLSYNDQGWGGYINTGRREKKYRPRLGFAVENDYQGVNIGAFMDRVPTTGPYNNYGVSGSVETYSRLSGKSYRKTSSLNTWVNLRAGLSISTWAMMGQNFGFDDNTRGFNLTYPYYDGRRFIGGSFTWGHQGGKPYQAPSLDLAYPVTKRIQTNFSAQFVDHFIKQTQWIGTATADLGGSQSLSTRFVRQQNNYNVYFSFRKSGTAGAEYFAILGDPNAQSFRTSLILKAVFPIEIRY